MIAAILLRPATFDRVDRVKVVTGQSVLPGDDRLWILGDAMVFSVNGAQHIVPTGFTTDGASVPDWAARLTGWDRWDEPQRWAAIAHDWLYCQRGCAKRYADEAFRALLDYEGATWLRREAMYYAVCLFGGPAYAADQEAGPMIYDATEEP